MLGLEAIIVPLTVELGKKVLNRVWPDVQAGRPVDVTSPARGAVASQWPMHRGSQRQPAYYEHSTAYQYLSTLQVNLLHADSIGVGLYADIVGFLLVVSERDGAAEFIEVDLASPVELELPDGVYSLYAFLLDRNARSMIDSPLYGLGIPAALDLDGVDTLEIEYLDDVADLILDAPLEVSGGEAFTVELLVLDPRDYPDLPQHFGDLFGEDEGEMTGSWTIHGDDADGRMYAEAGLAQMGQRIQGTVLTEWTSHQGDVWFVQQFVEGSFDGYELILIARHARVLKSPEGERGGYELDSWRGVYDPSRDSVAGLSEDTARQRGRFVMERTG